MLPPPVHDQPVLARSVHPGIHKPFDSHADGRSPVGDAVLEGVHVGRLVEAGQSSLVTLCIFASAQNRGEEGMGEAAERPADVQNYWLRIK